MRILRLKKCVQSALMRLMGKLDSIPIEDVHRDNRRCDRFLSRDVLWGCMSLCTVA